MKAICCVFLFMLIITPAYAGYTGLVIIPTAETVGAGQYTLEYQYDAVIQGETDNLSLFNTEIGIGDRFEAGIDFDLSKNADPVVFGDAKYLLYNKRDTALGLGVFSIGRNIKSSPYIVGLKDFDILRLHLGGVRIESENQWFIGADRTFDKWTLLADYTSGEGNFSSAGFTYQFNDRFSITAGAVLTNYSEESSFSLFFTYGAPYRSIERK